MFQNIGGKIKKIADWVLILGIISSIIWGIAIMVTDEELILEGFITMIVGSISAWLSSVLLYGFGQLIENSDKLVMMQSQATGISEPDLDKRQKEEEKVYYESKDEPIIGKCDMCGKENVIIYKCTIKDDLGTRYRNMCKECAEKNKM